MLSSAGAPSPGSNGASCLASVASAFPANSALKFEWSLKVDGEGVRQRDKAILWLERKVRRFSVEEVASLERLLKCSACPAAVLDLFQQYAPGAINIGLGCSPSLSWPSSLYIHYRPLGQLRAEYRAWFWKDSQCYDAADYSFHFFPSGAGGLKPEDCIHPSQLRIYELLRGDPLLSAISGFWLRTRRGEIEEIYLSFPWQPPFHSVSSDLLTAFPDAGLKEELRRYRAEHFRHIGFTGSRCLNPSLSIYFSGRVSQQEALDLETARTACQESSRRTHEFIRQRLRTLPGVPPRSSSAVETFYDTDMVPLWRRLLGKNLYCHFGLFPPGQDSSTDIWSEEPFERAVSELSSYIPSGSAVYDLGCGWGGPAAYLCRELDCEVTGITISKTQFEYCASLGLSVRHGDMEQTLPPGLFDVFLMLESFEHVRNKYALLKTLRQFGRRLVLRTSCQEHPVNNVVYAGTMFLVSAASLRHLLDETGWKITHWRDRRKESLPSIGVWNSRFGTIPPQPELHVETFRKFASTAAMYPKEWAAAHPLIEVCAE
jgi:2-polyprenyl-3-methyl-5-hydroxy-6-metoxy-1,4-benzoquinol methylase